MGKESEKVRRIRKEMVEIFGKQCWMDYYITRNNMLTAHHIVERRENGITCLENLALVTDRAHKLLNYFDCEYNKIYRDLNALFYELNRTLLPPTDDYFEEVKQTIDKAKKIPFQYRDQRIPERYFEEFDHTLKRNNSHKRKR